MFAVVAALSAALLVEFPFYPLLIALLAGCILGGVALQFPSTALWVALVLSMFAGFYQNSFLGVTYFIVFLLILALTTTWVEVALVAASLALALSSFPGLAVVPVVIAGLYASRESTLKIGVASALSSFLLSWSSGLSQAGLVLIPIARTDFVMQPIQNPWQFTAFLPNLDIFTSRAVMDYYAPLLANLEDFRVIILIVIWIVTGFVVALLGSKFKRTGYGIPAAAGCLPLIVASAVLASTSLTELALAFIGSIITVAAYNLATPTLAAPAARVFTGLKDLFPDGIPGKYSILLGSLGCDERNPIIEQFIHSSLGKHAPCFDLTADVGYGRSLASKFPEGLLVLVSSPRAGEAVEKNVLQIKSEIQNLTAVNIELVNAVKDRYKPGSLICLETISDILLSQKLLTTRRWISDLIPRLEGWGYTVLGVFNPALHSNEECQGIMDLFKGYVEITEKDYAGKQKRMIIVRKMADVKYTESELLLDREKLIGKGKKPSFRGR